MELHREGLHHRDTEAHLREEAVLVEVDEGQKMTATFHVTQMRGHLHHPDGAGGLHHTQGHLLEHPLADVVRRLEVHQGEEGAARAIVPAAATAVAGAEREADQEADQDTVVEGEFQGAGVGFCMEKNDTPSCVIKSASGWEAATRG